MIYSIWSLQWKMIRIFPTEVTFATLLTPGYQESSHHYKLSPSSFVPVQPIFPQDSLLDPFKYFEVFVECRSLLEPRGSGGLHGEPTAPTLPI